MKNHPDPNSYDLSLLQGSDHKKETLARMRIKLAGPSQSELRTVRGWKQARQETRVSWGWKLSLGAAAVAVNLFLFVFRDSITIQIKPKRAPILSAAPANLSLDDQALYLTYALYDFDRLQERFGAPRNTVVDAGAVRQSLEAIMPRVGRPTHAIIGKYRPVTRRAR